MLINFHKYHGNGNDFILIDNRSLLFPMQGESLIKLMCNRNFGIGADGLMLLENIPGYDFYMRYYNSDGREGSMCGNGGRCIVHFARELGIIDKNALFSGTDGPHEARVDNSGQVNLKMKNVDSISRDGNASVVDTGSPHYVIFTENIDAIDVVKSGREIRNSETYIDKGINVNFVEKRGNLIKVRTYERGVENETLACGTGSVAAAICSAFTNDMPDSRVRVETRGGLLMVSFKRSDDGKGFCDIWLTGPAKPVFRGTIDTGKLTEG